MGPTRKILSLLLLPMMLGWSGCSTLVNSHRQKESMMQAYVQGRDAEVAEELLYKLRPPSWYNSSVVNSGDEIQWRLEGGAFDFLQGKAAESIAHFERAESLIADFDQRAVVNLREAGAESAVLFTNPNALPYRGCTRDRVLIPVYKGLAYLSKGDEAGFRVEMFRLRENQQRIMADREKEFQAEQKALEEGKKENKNASNCANPDKIINLAQNQELSQSLAAVKDVAHKGYGKYLNPLAIFLSGYSYARDNDYQNAIVDYERLYQAMPSNPLAQRYYVTALRKTKRPVPPALNAVKELDFPIGERNVLVIFANGRSAALRQIALYIPVIIPGYYYTVATVAFPVCEYYPAQWKTLQVTADGKGHQTLPVADMDCIVSQEYWDRFPGMLTRTALSTAVKEIGSYFASQAASNANGAAGLAVMAGTSLYKIAMNTADTRGWEILPKEFQLAQFPMPADKKITVSPDGNSSVKAELKLPDSAKSAIVYVNAPGPGTAPIRCQVLSFQSK